jgi:pyruvate kinase
MKRQTKILATLGPASTDAAVISQLIDAGVNAFRLNFSHGKYEDHARSVKTIRTLAAEKNLPITILQDLQGPKLRLGEMDGTHDLKVGDTFVLDTNLENVGDKTRAPLPHPELFAALQEGDNLFLNDGRVKLQVTENTGEKITTIVKVAGPVSSRKGLNVPDTELPLSPLTKKDLADLETGLELGVDWVACSFVQRPEDMHELRKLVGTKAAIMAKIEKPLAIEWLDGIIAASDGIMIARGDLGIELPLAEVPALQKKIIRKCREVGKPVVVATQMLETMITNANPTRAEVSDVANATFEGADCLMLSAETAVGQHPVTVVETMAGIINRVEASSAWQPLVGARGTPTDGTLSQAITAAAAGIARSLPIQAVVTFTESGSTALRMAQQRPEQPILVLTPYLHTARRLNLVWGIKPALAALLENSDDLIKFSIEACHAHGIESGNIVVTAGHPYGKVGSTNQLRIVVL